MKQQVIGKTNTKETNNKSVETKNAVDVKQETKKVEPKPQENKGQEQKKEEQPVVIEQKEQETKQEVKTEDKTLKCKNGEHRMPIGNSNRWFDTENEAIAFYRAEVKKWSNKWTNDEIKDEEEYDKNCPCGYEDWSCPICQKWTINFYYRITE